MITINIYYTGTKGSARAFAKDICDNGIVDRIRRSQGNLRYEYFFPMDVWQRKRVYERKR